ncbi:RDD family protein [Paenibacillus sp. 481]|uniref:RDD family protein n=1 Tax=Paenibacillus sp. 481 TaxID=2835869 RepID=UPI001E4AB9D3|nr:RDD family protein [Paenibacillus sp. 481]UHA74213.1 RDD family protein [Paenibacillus sp. 481]
MTVQHVTYAGFWVRTIAFILDLTFIMSVFYLLFDFLLGDSNHEFYITISKLCLFCFYFFIFTYFFGQTLGKMVVGIKVVSKQNEKIAWEEVLLREVIGKFISIALAFSGFLLVAIDPQKQSIHDKLGNMNVIWEKR